MTTHADLAEEARRNLLLIEDNPADAAFVGELLRGSRYDVTTVDTIARAEQALGERPFHVALLDLRMPDSEPLQAVNRVLAKSDGVAVLALTHLDEDLAYRCLEAGVQDFIRKAGLTRSVLERGLEHAIVRARAAETARRLELAERQATLGSIASYIGHELNNQASVLLSGIELAIEKLAALRSRVEDAEQRVIDEVLANLEDRTEAVERCSSIVRQFKLLGSPQNGAPPSADVADVAERCVRTMDQMLRRKAIVALDLPPCAPAAIEEHKLAQVLVNLLRNAAEAIEGDPRTERIAVRLRDTTAHVVLSVADSGGGVSPEQRARMFRPFFSSKPEGTGLGLAISAEIVAAAGGSIDFGPNEDRGTVFTVTLPHARRPVGRAAFSAQVTPRQKRLRILLVDDDDELRSTLASLLRQHHDVVAAADGQQAIASLEGAPFDVIVCDLMMPGMDGTEVYEVVRTKRPEMSRRFTLLTGGAFTESAAELVKSGEVVVLHKPFSYRKLMATLMDLADGVNQSRGATAG